MEITKKWQQENCNHKMIQHSLRTLLKSGNQKALELMGYNKISAKITNFKSLKEIKIGDNLSFSFILNNEAKNNIRIEYAIYFLLKNGKFYRKIFQIKQGNFSKDKFSFNKKHSFKKITTRKYYSGIHKIGIILNGKEILKENFNLRNAP